MMPDLDGADLVEVRRRAVEPVARRLLRGPELERVEVVLDLGPAEGGRSRSAEDAPLVWAVVVACGDRFAACLGELGFERWHADAVATEFAAPLRAWIATSSFGRGQQRAFDPRVPLPRPIWPRGAPGQRVLEVYPGAGVEYPVWERGVNVAEADLGVSARLRGDLLGWRAVLERATAPTCPMHWLEVVDVLEPARDDLVERLRLELAPAVTVARPLRLASR